MKSPAVLKQRLLNQWENPDRRESRLIESFDAWPIALSIGRPEPDMPSKDAARLKQHIETWGQVKVGEVEWQRARFPTLRESVNIPSRWLLHNPTDWVAAIDEARVVASLGRRLTCPHSSPSVILPKAERHRTKG